MPKKERLNLRNIAKQSRAEQTVSAVLEASTRLFAKFGLSRTTTNRIAEVAGVSIGTLYQYFSSKESIVALLVERRLRKELEYVERRLRELEHEPLEVAVREFIRCLVRAYVPDAQVDAVLLTALGRVQKHRRFLEIQAEGTRMIQKFLEAHPRSAEYLPENMEMASFIMVQAVHSSIHAALVLRPELIEQDRLAEELVRMCLRYLVDSPKKTEP